MRCRTEDRKTGGQESQGREGEMDRRGRDGDRTRDEMETGGNTHRRCKGENRQPDVERREVLIQTLELEREREQQEGGRRSQRTIGKQK